MDTNLDYLRTISTQEQRKVITAALRSWAGCGDSYIYDLTRVKSAFDVGTMELDDFVEWDEDRIEEIANEFVLWLNSHAIRRTK